MPSHQQIYREKPSRSSYLISSRRPPIHHHYQVDRTPTMTNILEMAPEEVDIPFSILDTDLYKVTQPIYLSHIVDHPAKCLADDAKCRPTSLS